MFNNSKVGDKVICNGFPGIVIRNKHSPDSEWMGGIENGEEWGMVEVRLAAGAVCVSDTVPNVIPQKKG